ncbi:Com family DNA-binding transcriptional regulator [Acinetobacter piscicola]|uniref:Com family DNA-binding transcriptional regulator n=1 Tax=Acinetobacter piscicola TaxID=2006115 RepID=UPI003556811F
MMEMIKCRSCDRLLCKIGLFDAIEIKCPRCKTLNFVSVQNALPDCPEQQRDSAHAQSKQSDQSF